MVEQISTVAELQQQIGEEEEEKEQYCNSVERKVPFFFQEKEYRRTDSAANEELNCNLSMQMQQQRNYI